jgi:hypothetical protein
MRSLQSYLFLGMHGAELSAYECVCRESILPAGPEPPARDQTESGTGISPPSGGWWFGHRCWHTEREILPAHHVGWPAEPRRRLARPRRRYCAALRWAKTWPTRGPSARGGAQPGGPARPISELSAAVVSPANSYGFVDGMIHAHYLELYRGHVQSGSAHNEDGRPPT